MKTMELNATASELKLTKKKKDDRDKDLAKILRNSKAGKCGSR